MERPKVIWAGYTLLVLLLVLLAPDPVLTPGTTAFVVLLGVVGAWRYSWGFVHLLRSAIYRGSVFPKLRRAAERFHPSDESNDAPATSQLYIVVTSYRIQPETTAAMFRAALTEAISCNCPATIVASVVEVADQRLLKALFRSLSPPDRVRLLFVRLPGRGKRDALAVGLRAISRQLPDPDAAVVVMDGDTVLPPATLIRTVPLLRLLPRVAALTTDEDAIVSGSRAMLVWHRLRFAQRDVLMGSLGLSRRLLALTGRMSVFRAAVAVDPEFITRIERDGMDHWRLGRFRFLTGEDKSTWLWVLERGYDMLYVPDVRVLTIEHPPAARFLPATTRLMIRWFGNMLRASGQALALGPARTGLFLWWCILDQRISMWTPLIGPVAALLLGMLHSWLVLYAYLLWVMGTRMVQALALLTVRRTVSGAWPLLIFFNQVYGALIKTWILFRLDRQQWTRQGITSPRRPASATGGQALVSLYLHGLALSALVTMVGFATGMLRLPLEILPMRMF